MLEETNIVPEAQYRNLQALVGELLMTNQKLRQELARFQQTASSATATHPQRHLAH